MITPSFGLTATERVLPRLALDWTTGVAQSGVDVTRAGVATFVGSNGLIQSATADTQRVDYLTGTAGLLVEESRTNTALYSEDVSSAVVWAKNRLNYTVDATTSPDGLQTADLIYEDTNTNTHLISQLQNITSGVTYVFSVFAKQKERNVIQIVLGGGVFNNVYANFDLANGVVSSISASGITASIVPLTNGWYRCIAVSTAIGTNATYAGPAWLLQQSPTAARNTSYEGDGASGLYVWGFDNQVGAFPTSYIPTEATAVTRNADVATMTGTNFSDWYNQTEGSLAVEFIPANPSGIAANLIATLSDNSLNNRMMQLTENNNLFVLTRVSGSGSNNVASSFVYDNALTKSVFGYSASGNSLSVNGGAANTTAQANPTVDRLFVGGNATGGVVGSKTVQKIFYYPQKLTNAEIQAFSK